VDFKRFNFPNSSAIDIFGNLVPGNRLLDPIDEVGDLGVDAGIVRPRAAVTPADHSNLFLIRGVELM
jgi:hypothetical protein